MTLFNALYVFDTFCKGILKGAYSSWESVFFAVTFPAATSLSDTTMSSFFGELTR
jgi:hypothetical protein